MSEFLKVEGHNNLVRESDSKAIINTDKNSYRQYMKTMEQKRKQKDQLRDAVREINTLKCEMHEIKSLLLKLVDKK